MIEQAVFFPATSPSLVGVLTANEKRPDRSVPAGVFLNAGLLHRVGPNRLYVRIAREMAGRGFASLRFDLSGIGDSPARTDSLAPRATALRDALDAVDFVSRTHEDCAIILIGLCSGADLAFRVALADTRVVGAVLIDALPYQTARSRFFGQLHRVGHVIDRGEWPTLHGVYGPVSRDLASLFTHTQTHAHGSQERDIPSKTDAEKGLRALTGRGVRLLMIYTEGRGYNYQRQFADLFPSVPRESVQVEYFKGVDHTFNLLSSQDRLVRTVGDWIAKF